MYDAGLLRTVKGFNSHMSKIVGECVKHSKLNSTFFPRLVPVCLITRQCSVSQAKYRDFRKQRAKGKFKMFYGSAGFDLAFVKYNHFLFNIVVYCGLIIISLCVFLYWVKILCRDTLTTMTPFQATLSCIS